MKNYGELAKYLIRNLDVKWRKIKYFNNTKDDDRLLPCRYLKQKGFRLTSGEDLIVTPPNGIIQLRKVENIA